MAVGRHGGYRDNVFRDKESNLRVSRQRDYYYSRVEHDQYDRRSCHDSDRDTKHGRDLERGREHNFGDRVRQRNVEEREVVNGGYHSSLSSNNSASSSSSLKQAVFRVRTVDREPGELSSGSGSDDGEMSKPKTWKDDYSGWKTENQVQTLPGKKRKFSPVIWDRENKPVINASRNGTDLASGPLSPPPPFPLVPNSSTSIQTSPVKPPSATRSAGSALSQSPTGLSPSSPVAQRWSNDHGSQQMNEDYLPLRNISASRWADENNSPDFEGEASDGEGIHKRQKVQVMSGKASSPELGEIPREGSSAAWTKSSSIDKGGSVGSASGDECAESELNKNDFLEVDEEDVRDGASSRQTETDSQGEDELSQTADPSVSPQRSINMLQGCRSVDEFERLNRINEGTYGVVYRARDKKSGEIVALKKVKMEREREGFPLTSLREINILLSFHHPSIVDVKEVVVGSSLDSIFMVMEYMEHDLKRLIEVMKQPFHPSQVKCLMLQLLEGVKYLHDNWVLHRDLKTSNLLLNNRGELKICDFGLSRQYGSPLKPYTPLVVTLWYRAPELLLGAKEYSTAIDMWSVGCIMAELLCKEPLFSGKTEFDQLDKIFRMLGSPNEKIWPGFVKLPGFKVNFVKQPYNKLRDKFPRGPSFSGRPNLSDLGFDLLSRLLTYDPEKRITAEEALNHGWFSEVPVPTSKDLFPTFPSQNAQDRRQRRIMKSPDPLQEPRRKELQQLI